MDLVFFILIGDKIKGNFDKFMWQPHKFYIITCFYFFSSISNIFWLICSREPNKTIEPKLSPHILSCCKIINNKGSSRVHPVNG